MQGEPDGSPSSEEEAELRTLRGIASALERDDIDELAAALLEEPDPAWPAPGALSGDKKNDSL